MNPLVSIIIPTFNRAHLIGETLDSIMAQTYTNWECIIVDDGSTDNTEEVLSKFVSLDKRFQYFKRPNSLTKGVSSSRNFGHKKALGKYINFVDSDDVLTSNHLEYHLNMLLAEKVSCSVTNAKIFIDSIDNITVNWSVNNATNLLEEMSGNRVLWAIGTVVWEKSCLPDNPFNSKLINSEEWLLHLLQIIRGIKYKVSNETTYLVRSHYERVGKIMSEDKIRSIFFARVLLFIKLKNKKLITKKNEENILKDVFFALRFSIEHKFFNITFLILRWFFLYFLYFQNKLRILKVVLISVPIYTIFRKGEKLFK